MSTFNYSPERLLPPSNLDHVWYLVRISAARTKAQTGGITMAKGTKPEASAGAARRIAMPGRTRSERRKVSRGSAAHLLARVPNSDGTSPSTPSLLGGYQATRPPQV